MASASLAVTAAASVEDRPLNSGAYVGLEAQDTNRPAPTRAATTAIAVIAFWPPVKPENSERTFVQERGRVEALHICIRMISVNASTALLRTATVSWVATDASLAAIM